MATIAPNSLPPAHTVATRDESVVNTTRSTRLPFQHVPDPQLQPRLFQATWRSVPGAVARAIRAHFEEHTHTPFRITIPRTGEIVVVVWRSYPVTQWASAAFATSVTAELEEIPAVI